MPNAGASDPPRWIVRFKMCLSIPAILAVVLAVVTVILATVLATVTMILSAISTIFTDVVAGTGCEGEGGGERHKCQG